MQHQCCFFRDSVNVTYNQVFIIINQGLENVDFFSPRSTLRLHAHDLDQYVFCMKTTASQDHVLDLEEFKDYVQS